MIGQDKNKNQCSLQVPDIGSGMVPGSTQSNIFLRSPLEIICLITREYGFIRNIQPLHKGYCSGLGRGPVSKPGTRLAGPFAGQYPDGSSGETSSTLENLRGKHPNLSGYRL